MTIEQEVLFQPLQVGNWQLKHRVVLAPLTRLRSVQNTIQPTLTGTYYAQRATPGGLLITEATGVSAGGLGNPHAPGIWTLEQRDAWRAVVDTVRASVPDAVLVLQLWHQGRVCHSDFLPDNTRPVAPSPIANQYRPVADAAGKMVPYEVPRALAVEEIRQIVAEFGQASRYAKEAGFDGVEIHAANGYLVDQFLQTATNQRTDEYGGNIERRVRFLREVLAAAVSVFGAGRVGVRFSPFNRFNCMSDGEAPALFSAAIRAACETGVAYVHLVEPRVAGAADLTETAEPPSIDALAKQVCTTGTVLIRAGGYQLDTASATVAAQQSDLIAFGRWFISNPDLPARIQHQLPWTLYDRSTFYTYDERGYTDYAHYSPNA